MYKRIGITAVVGWLVGCACNRGIEEERDLLTPCKIYCDRLFDCAKDVAGVNAGDTREECCTQECLSNPAFDKACGDEAYEYLECTSAPENSCPTFAEIYTVDQGPCREENDAHSQCVTENAS